jgi:hypothetical protein
MTPVRFLIPLAVLVACGGPAPVDPIDPSLPIDCDASDLVVSARTVDESGGLTSTFLEVEEVLVEVGVRNPCGNTIELVTSHSCLVPAIAISGELADGGGFGSHYTAACKDTPRLWVLDPGDRVTEVHRIAAKPVGKFFAAVVFGSLDLAGASVFFEVVPEDGGNVTDDDDSDPFEPDPISADPTVCDGDDLGFSVEMRNDDGWPRVTFNTQEMVHAVAVIKNPCDEMVEFSTPHVCIVPAWTILSSSSGFAGSYAGCHELDRTVWSVPSQGQREEGRPLERLDAGVYMVTIVSSSAMLGAAAVEFSVLD